MWVALELGSWNTLNPDNRHKYSSDDESESYLPFVLVHAQPFIYFYIHSTFDNPSCIHIVISPLHGMKMKLIGYHLYLGGGGGSTERMQCTYYIVIV
jgi:hypothetical protein